MADLSVILTAFSPYDHDHDETLEIISLDPMPSPNPLRPLYDSDKLLLIIVNKKVLDKTPRRWHTLLLNDLETFRLDLEREGYVARTVVADVYAGPKHQDGMTVLAVRKFFQEVRKSYPHFQGAILIGSFPEALLVRTYAWRKKAGYGEKGVMINGKRIEGKEYLEIRPDVIATRSDLVLCDLDGDWDSIYLKKKTTLHSLLAVPEDDGMANWAEYGTTSVIDRQLGPFDPTRASFEENHVKDSYVDFFLISDGAFTLTQNIASLSNEICITVTRLNISSSRDVEICAADKSHPNPLATPKIIVSRIDASHSAIVPDPDYPSDKNEPLLDAHGKPQAISASQVLWHLMYKLDDELEVTLLMQYLARNHKYRNGAWEEAVEYSAIAGPDFKKSEIMDSVLGADSFEYTGRGDPPEPASPAQYVAWLRKRALIRAINTHANGGFFSFRDLYAEKETDTDRLIGEEIYWLDAYLGRNPERWYWDIPSQTLVPGWRDLFGQAGIHVHKALWMMGMEHSCVGGTFYFPAGCDVTSVSIDVPYNDAAYAKGQLAESLLFYVRGLAVLGRAKTFNDFPPHVALIFEQQRKPFGEIWREYFNVDRQDKSLDTVEKGIARKRSYSWGHVGDWTVKIVYSKTGME